MKSQTEVQGSAVVRTTSSAPSTQPSRVRALSSCLGSRRVSGRIPGASGSLDCWATGPAGMKSYVEGSWTVWKAPRLARLHCARSCRGAVESREAYFWTWDKANIHLLHMCMIERTGICTPRTQSECLARCLPRAAKRKTAHLRVERRRTRGSTYIHCKYLPVR